MFLGLRENIRDYQVRIPHVLRDVRQLLFLGIGLPVRSRAGFDAGGSRGPEDVDLEIRCVVGLVSAVAVDHRQEKNLPAACESNQVILRVNVGW
jgi:hypothetical protein